MKKQNKTTNQTEQNKSTNQTENTNKTSTGPLAPLAVNPQVYLQKHFQRWGALKLGM